VAKGIAAEKAAAKLKEDNEAKLKDHREKQTSNSAQLV
jgi:hypothetical protein